MTCGACAQTEDGAAAMTMQPSSVLSVHDHRRDIAGLTYVYPVVSRRAGGVSVGVNLNTNSACNWRCVYCQVPGLVRGAAPKVDLDLLESELEFLLRQIVRGDYLERNVAEGARRLNDIALSGNGEPTSAREFDQVVERIGQVRRRLGLSDSIKTILITNGSLLHRPEIKAGLSRLRDLAGEVWFKLDRGSVFERERLNGTSISNARVMQRLAIAARLCSTWIQTCMFALDGVAPSAATVQEYLELLQLALARELQVKGVLLYGLARVSQQPEAQRLSPVSGDWLDQLAARIRLLGLPVLVTP